MQYDKVVELVEDAKRNGARVLCGGEAPEASGYFYPVTIVAGRERRDADRRRRAVRAGACPSSATAISRTQSNAPTDSTSGSAGQPGRPIPPRAKEVAGRLECGTAWINGHGGIKPFAPFGGVKGSGIGVEFGKLGLEEYTTVQVVHH